MIRQKLHEAGARWLKGEGKAGEKAPLGKLEEGIRAPTACPNTSASDSLQGQLKLIHN